MKIMRKVVEVNGFELYKVVNEAVKGLIGESGGYELGNVQCTVNSLIFDEPEKVQEVELMSFEAIEDQRKRFAKPSAEQLDAG